MKKIAVLTDFSAKAFNAAEYALSLAIHLHADILLYNSFLIPSADPMSAQIVWPMEDYEEIKEGCNADLHLLKTQLDKRFDKQSANFRPKIECLAMEGVFNLSVDNFPKDRELILLVMANHHQGFSSLMLGNHTKGVLDHSTLPVLVVPEGSRFETLQKIIFATDLNPDDLNVIQSLASLARPFSAEILLTHLCKSTSENDEQVKDFLHEVINKINYPHIYYRQLSETHVQQGLQHMSETIQVDMTVMVHRHKDFLARLFGNSHSQKLASRTDLPLLIFPNQSDRLPFF